MNKYVIIGFIFPVRVNFELFETSANELGLISEIFLVSESKIENFFIVNLKKNAFKIEAFSKNIISKKFLNQR